MNQAINYSDIVEKNGKTIRQNNMEMQCGIPLGTLVEINSADFAPEWHGCRLYVVKHCRDCDGTTLYALGKKGEQNRLMMISNGWSENNLIIVKLSDDHKSSGMTFGELSIGDLFVTRLPTATEKSVILMRKTASGDKTGDNAETCDRGAFAHFPDNMQVVFVDKAGP